MIVVRFRVVATPAYAENHCSTCKYGHEATFHEDSQFCWHSVILEPAPPGHGVVSYDIADTTGPVTLHILPATLARVTPGP